MHTYAKVLHTWIFWIILISLITIGVYSSSVQNDFTLDDIIITTGEYPATIWEIGGLLTEPVQYRNMRYYRPFTFATFTVHNSLLKGHSLGYHLSNICLSIISSCLLLLCLTQIWKLPYSGIVIVLFSIFPGHSEVILGIYNRSQILATIFCSLSLWSMMRVLQNAEKAKSPPQKNEESDKTNNIETSVPQNNRAKFSILSNDIWCYIALAGIFTFVSCLSKESGLVIPVVFIIILLWQRPYVNSYKNIVWIFVGQSIAIGTYLYMRWNALGTLGVPNVDAFVMPDGIWTRCCQHCHIFFRYLSLLAWPYPLSPDYPLIPVQEYYSLILFCIMLGGAIYSISHIDKKVRTCGALFFWFWIHLLPVLHLVPVQIAMADRMLYPASLAGMIAIVILFTWLPDTISFHYRTMWLRYVCGIFLALIAIVYGIHTWQYSSLWKNNDTLWQHTQKTFPNSYRAWIHQGNMAGDAGKYTEAYAFYTKALDASPNTTNRVLIHQNKAILAGRQENWPVMIEEWHKILELCPYDRVANLMLGDWYLQNNEYSKAIEYYQNISPQNRWDKDFISVMERLGHCYEHCKLWEYALLAYEIILERVPSHPQIYYIYYRLACVYHHWGKGNMAEKMYQKAKIHKPANTKLPEIE